MPSKRVDIKFKEIEEITDEVLRVIDDLMRIGETNPNAIKRREDKKETINRYVRRIAEITGMKLKYYSIIDTGGNRTGTVIRRSSSTGKLYDLTFFYDDTQDMKLFPALLAQQIVLQIFELKFLPENALNISHGIIWDRLTDRETQNRFKKFWEPYDKETTIAKTAISIPLYNFVRHRHQLFPKKFSEEMLQGFFEYKSENHEEEGYFPYRRSWLDFSKIFETDIKVWDAIINTRHKNIKELAEEIGISYPVVVRVREKLIFYRFFSTVGWFYPSAFGLNSYFLMIESRGDISEELWRWRFPIRLEIYQFTGIIHLYIVHFLSSHKIERIERKINRLCESLDLLDKPIVGIEEEDKRFFRMKPTLYDGEWKTGKQSKESLYGKPNGRKATYLERKILIEWLSGNVIRKRVFEQIGGNKQNFYKAIRRMDDENIAWVQQEMPLLTNLFRVGIILPANRQEGLIERYCSKLPFVKMWCFRSLSGSYIIALVGLPTRNARAILQDMVDNFTEVKIGLLTSHSLPAEEVNIKPTREGWRGTMDPTYRK